MEIYKKGQFGRHKLVMFGLDPKEVGIVLKALPEEKYFYYDSENKKVFHKSPEVILDEWVG